MRSSCKLFFSILPAVAALGGNAFSQTPCHWGDDFARYAVRLQAGTPPRTEPLVLIPTTGGCASFDGYPWKTNIVTTVFWIGEHAAHNNPVPNIKSSWDTAWESNYGGLDDPDPRARRDYIPVAFVPRKNPFYFALPYNDVTQYDTKPEAYHVIPWFKETFQHPGKSVCQNRWIAIRGRNGRVCYAQWSDCGPFRTDHWEYVFGNERPKYNMNGGAGLDVSPAVRDYLGFGTQAVCDWKFVEANEVPPGPWSLYGNNNDFVLKSRKSGAVARNEKRPSQFLHQFKASFWTAIISRGSLDLATGSTNGLVKLVDHTDTAIFIAENGNAFVDGEERTLDSYRMAAGH